MKHHLMSFVPPALSVEVLGQLCAVVSLGGDVALFVGVATAQRVCLDLFHFKRTLEIFDEFYYTLLKNL